MADTDRRAAPDEPVASYFSGRAETYAAHRPTYPVAVAEAALAGLPHPRRAADVGCGTGIASRLLAEAGADVVGIDPNAEMLERARRDPHPVTARIRYLEASAAATGLPDASVDLVLCAQSFHWFEPASALAEFRRILTDRGRLALLWNVRPAEDAAGRGYEAVVRLAMDDASRRGLVVPPFRSYRLEQSPLFVNVHHLRTDNPQRLDRHGLLGRARSASYFPASGALREELEARLHRLFDEHARDGRITIRQHADLALADVAPRQ